MKYCIGFSEEENHRKAVADVLNQIDNDEISFILYFSDSERFEDVTKEISSFLPDVKTMGSSTYLVISSKGIGKKAIGVLALYSDTFVSLGLLPDITVFPFQYIQNVADVLATLPLDKKSICFEITSAFKNGEERILDIFHKVVGDSVELFGGTAGNDSKSKETFVAQNGVVYNNACVFAFLSIEMDVFINREHVFRQTNKIFTVTDANPDKRVIFTLDNVPTAEALSNELSIPQNSLKDYLTLHPIGHIINQNQYIIEPLNINEDGSISFFAQVFKHSRVAVFEENNVTDVFENTKAVVKKAVKNPSFSLVVNCMARSKRFEELNCIDSLKNSLDSYCGEYLGLSGYGEQYSTHHFNQSLITATFFEKENNSDNVDILDEDIDNFTGIYNETGFIKQCKTTLDDNLEINYALCVFKINNFRVVNDTFGFEKGDEILQFVAKSLKRDIKTYEVCGHLHSTVFAFLVPYTLDVIDKLSKIKYIDCSAIDIPYQLTVKAGLCNINDVFQGDILFSDIRLAIDYSMIAMSKILNTSITSFCFYNHNMHKNLITEAEITSKMRDGLKRKEFQIYFQPQYNHSTGCLYGAEALCRWVNPDGSMVSPTVFIPVFEKNGFIQELDKYIWDRTFSIVSDWIKRKLDPVTISTNISRISLRNPGLPQHFARLCIQYDVDPSLIHLEFTESAYMENQEQIITTAKNFQKEGFKIAMDDFGSGYSSLNTLKDLPIDILKFDMEFVKGSSSSRGGTILASMIKMAQNLNLQTITEGVEDKKTADYIRSVGGDVIQGYLYSKPLSQVDFENVLINARKRTYEHLYFEKELNINNFYNPDSVESRLFSDYIGPAAIFNWENGEIDISRINESYLKEVGLADEESQYIQKDFFKTMTKESKENYIKAIEEAVGGKKVSICISERKFPQKADSVWIKSQLWCVSSIGKRYIIYALIDNVSNLKNEEKKSMEMVSRMQTIIENSPNGICLFKAKVKPIGYDLELIYVNKKFCEMTHYDKDKLYQYSTKDLLHIIDAKDRARVALELKLKLLKYQKGEFVYNAWGNDGKKHKVKLNTSVLPQGGNEYFVVSNFSIQDNQE
jgi:diguanylate cyclase (GGDEF)-like protein